MKHPCDIQTHFTGVINTRRVMHSLDVFSFQISRVSMSPWTSPEAAAADQRCHLAANNDDHCVAEAAGRDGVADDNSIKSALFLSSVNRMRKRGGSPMTSSLSRRLLLTFVVFTVVTMYCSRIASAVSVASSSTGW
jgi:hypothetical protein